MDVLKTAVFKRVFFKKWLRSTSELRHIVDVTTIWIKEFFQACFATSHTLKMYNGDSWAREQCILWSTKPSIEEGFFVFKAPYFFNCYLSFKVHKCACNSNRWNRLGKTKCKVQRIQVRVLALIKSDKAALPIKAMCVILIKIGLLMVRQVT